MSWGKIIVGGVEYDLSHLDAFMMRVTPKAPNAPSYSVLVNFGCHTFTRELQPGDPADLRFPDDGAMRAFCTTRHEHSLHLRASVESAANGKVFFNNKSRFVIVGAIPDVAGPYAIYFNAMRGRTKGIDAVVDVRSAHHKPNLPLNLPRITFATLIGNVVAGRPIKMPKK